MKFPERLKKARENYHETQDQLGLFLGVTQRTISNWECGKREPSLAVFDSIAERYGVTADWLLGRSPHPNAYAYPLGEIDGQSAMLISSDPTPITEEKKAELMATAQSPNAMLPKFPKDLPQDREELMQLIRSMIAEARQKDGRIIDDRD